MQVPAVAVHDVEVGGAQAAVGRDPHVTRRHEADAAVRQVARIHVVVSLEQLGGLAVTLRVDVALAPKEHLVEAINKYYGMEEGESADSMLQEFTDTAIDFTEMETEGATASDIVDENSAPVIRLVHLMITEAVQLRASDIHIEPFEDRLRIRYRIDGVLVERDSPPKRLLAALVSRIKVMGRIDIAEKRRPQDGRIKTRVAGKDFDLRVSVLPTNHGQAIVIRILDRDNIKIGIRNLGFSEENYRKFQTIIRRPNGIFLVTGHGPSGLTLGPYSAKLVAGQMLGKAPDTDLSPYSIARFPAS